MDYKKVVKKHTIIIVLCAICGVFLLAGTSYALFFQVNTNSENQVVKTGKLEITYGDQSSRITLTSLTPIEDQDALGDSNYSSSVNIKNTGSLPASYDLKIGKDIESLEAAGGSANEFVNLSYVRVAVYIGEDELLAPCSLGDKQLDENGMYSLKTDTLAPNASVNVIVKVWLDKDTPSTETGKYVYLKLAVDSVVDEASTPEGQVNTGN